MIIPSQAYILWTEDESRTKTVIRSAHITNPADDIVFDAMYKYGVGNIKAIMALDERLQPMQKGNG